jgi:hypothetical protein
VGPHSPTCLHPASDHLRRILLAWIPEGVLHTILWRPLQTPVYVCAGRGGQWGGGLVMRGLSTSPKGSSGTGRLESSYGSQPCMCMWYCAEEQETSWGRKVGINGQMKEMPSRVQ